MRIKKNISLGIISWFSAKFSELPFLSFLIYLNTWHLGVPKFSFKRVRVLEIHPTQPRGGHPSHSNLVRGKLTSPTPNPAGDGTSGLTSYPRRRSKVSEATCLRPQRSAPSRTWTRAVQPRVQRSDHWATHASRANIIRIVWQTVRRTSNKILGIKGLM